MRITLALMCTCGEELEVEAYLVRALPATMFSPEEPACVTDVNVIMRSCICLEDQEDLIAQVEEFFQKEQPWWDEGDVAYQNYVDNDLLALI